MFQIFAQIHTSCNVILREVKRDIGSTMEIAGGVFISPTIEYLYYLKTRNRFFGKTCSCKGIQYFMKGKFP